MSETDRRPSQEENISPATLAEAERAMLRALADALRETVRTMRTTIGALEELRKALFM